MIHQRYELSSDTLDLCKGKLVPGIAATWGEVTGNIENQKDLVSYISAHGGGNAEWGSISGNLSDQTDLMGYMDRFATTAWIGEQDYLHKYNASEDKSMIFNTNIPAIYLRNTVSSQLNINPWTISMFGGSTGALITPNTVGTHMGEASSYKTAGAICDTELSSAVLIVRDAEDYLKIDCHNIYTYSGGISTTYPLSEIVSRSDLSQYATRQWVTGRGYATQSWVESQGYASAADLSGYIHFDESSPLSGIGKTLPFYSSTVGLFPVYQSFSSTWVNIEMTTDPGGWVSMGLACYDETGSSEIWRDRFITENDMTGYVSRSYVDWSVQAQGYPFSFYTPADASGNYILGSLDDTTQAFTGIKVSDSQAGAYIVTSADNRYQESFSPFATEDWIYENEDILKFTDKGVDYDVIDRPDVNPDQDEYNSAGYILSLSEIYDEIVEDGDDIRRKIVNYLLCEDQSIINRQLFYHEVDGEWELQNEYEYQPYWQGCGWDVAEIHVLSADPDYEDRLEDFPVDTYFTIGWDKLPFGVVDDDGESLSFNGFCWDQEDEKLGLYKVTPIIVPGVGPDGYEEEFKAFALDDDLTTLASRVTSLETNYGDAVTITNNILGV